MDHPDTRGDSGARPLVDLESLEIDPAVIGMIAAEIAWKYQVLPLSRSRATLRIAMSEPSNMFALDDIRFLTGLNLEPSVGSNLDRALLRHYGPMPGRGTKDGARATVVSLRDLLDAKDLTLDGAVAGQAGLNLAADQGRPIETHLVVRLIHAVVLDSLKRGAHDIHIEPCDGHLRVRFRIDGALFNIMALPGHLKEAISSQIKMMARIDIGEGRGFQEGQLKITMAAGDRSRDVRFRVSCMPTLLGETFVLRLCDESNFILDMTELGFEEDSLRSFKRAIARARGLVLICGPARSGKTNTLYSAISSLQRADRKIVTAEQLVECTMHGINQVQVRAPHGPSLAVTLDAFLRQDIDVVMADEIVDKPSAEAVVRIAACAGPLLIASLNETDAASATQMLAHLSGQPFLLGRALIGVVAQTLVRRICARCRIEVTEAPAEDLVALGVLSGEVGTFKHFRGKGCSACFGTGYLGRVGLYEVMEISEGIRPLVQRGAAGSEIRRTAVENGMVTLRTRGLEKVKAGTTTLEEALRQTASL